MIDTSPFNRSKGQVKLNRSWHTWLHKTQDILQKWKQLKFKKEKEKRKD